MNIEDSTHEISLRSLGVPNFKERSWRHPAELRKLAEYQKKSNLAGLEIVQDDHQEPDDV